MARNREILFCLGCGETDPKEISDSTQRLPFCKSCLKEHRQGHGIFIDDQAKQIAAKRWLEARLLNGEPRSNSIASLRCVADPDESYLGSYFYEAEMRNNLTMGVMPSGSLWINDHDNQVYEVLGSIGEKQNLLPVSSWRLKKLEARFPRLKRALSSPAVY